MRRFIVEVVVLTIAMAATIGLLSLVEVGGVPLLLIEQGAENQLDIFIGPLRLDLLVGLILAIGSSVVPLLLAVLFGRWYLRHPIGALVGANAVLFVAVATVSGWIASPFLVPEPALLWLIVDSLAFTVVFVALDAVLGFHRPHVGDRPRHRSLWARLDRMPATDRNVLVENLRLYEVWQTVTGYLQDIALARTPLRPLRRIGDRLAGASSASLDALSAPAKVRVMLQQLGPTYVKLGQMVGSRGELLPADWAAEMERLQSDVPPFPWPVAAAIIESELGRPPSELFASIDEQPLGAASLAQVHRATLHDGRDVVVKIQRPEIGARVRADLGVMQELAVVAEDRFAFARRFGLRQVIDEFAAGVREELDYTVEAYNARRLADVLADIDGVGVPAIHQGLSTERVLVMDFVDGVKVTHIDRVDAAVDRTAIARALVAALIQQLLVEGFFHGDPHPGNVVLDPHDGRVTFLDLGLMGELRTPQRLDLMALVYALRAGDPAMLAAVTRRLCVAIGPVDEEAFAAGIGRIFYRSWRYGSGALGGVMTAVFALLGEQHLRMRRDLVMAVKALTQAEELIRAVDPGLPMIDLVVDEGKGLVLDALGRWKQRAVTGDLAALAGDITGDIPGLDGGPLPVLAAALGIDPLPRPSSSTTVTSPASSESWAADGTRRLGIAITLAGMGITLALVTLAVAIAPVITDGLVAIALLLTLVALLAMAVFARRTSPARPA